MRRPIILVIMCVVAIAAFSRAQVRAQSDARPLAFEVASVKPNMSGDDTMTLRVQTSGRLIVTNMTLGALISSAYRTPAGALRASQIVGGPDWLNRDHFDIDARGHVELPPPGSPVLPPDSQEMLKSLLADRFKLIAHQESREQPVYDLVRARDDRLGPQLHLVQADCNALRVAGRDAFLAGRPASPNARPICSVVTTSTMMTGGSATMAQLATILSSPAGRLVRDHTGLAGLYDLDLSWTPPGPAASVDAPATDQDGVSLFTAVREQLGLRLQSTKESANILVIDHVEHPTED